MFLTLLNDLNVTSVGSFDLDCPPSQDTSQRKNDTTHIYILYNVYMNMSIYIYKRNIQYRYYVHTTYHFEPKKQPSLLPQKKWFRFTHLFQSKKNTTRNICQRQRHVIPLGGRINPSTTVMRLPDLVNFWLQVLEGGRRCVIYTPIFSRKTLGFLVKKCQEKWMWKS